MITLRRRANEVRPAPENGADPHPALPVCGIRVLRHDGWSAILLRGELDGHSSSRLERRLREEVRRGRPVIVELAGLDFTDVNGVRALQRGIEDGASRQTSVPVELHGARGQVADLIARIGLEHLVERTSRC